MSEVGVYMLSVLGHWIAWGTGSFLSLSLLILDQYFGWKTPKSLFGGFLLIGVLVSCLQAWHDQYKENEGGRTSGSLALERIEFFGAMPSPTTRKADVQLTLVLKNIQPRLMECDVDKIEAQIQGKRPSDEYTNKGGYVYAGNEISLQLPFIKDTDILPTVAGELEYSISYNLVGSSVKHRSSKQLRFTSYPGRKTDYLVVSESEK